MNFSYLAERTNNENPNKYTMVHTSLVFTHKFKEAPIISKYYLSIKILTHQPGLVGGWLALLGDLEDTQNEDLGIRTFEGLVVTPAYHLEEVGRQTRAGVELDVACQDVVRGRRLARHVPAHVYRVEQFVLGLVHLGDARVHPGRRLAAVSLAKHYFGSRWDLKNQYF